MTKDHETMPNLDKLILDIDKYLAAEFSTLTLRRAAKVVTEHLHNKGYIRKALLTEEVDVDALRISIDNVREFNKYRDEMSMKQNYSQNILLRTAEHLLKLIDLGEK